MFEVDQAGRIYDYYAPAREMLYVPPEVFLGKTFNEVLPESTADTILQALAQAAQQGWHRGATYALDLPTGRHWFELSIATKGEPNPTQTHFLVLARDVTERKQAEEALRERDRLRIALEKEKELNTIKNNIMQTISHEFRTPLAVMSSSSFLLTHYYDRLNSDQRKEQLESIRSQVEKLDQMVEGIVSTAQGMVDELVFQPSHTNLELLGHLTVTELQSTAGAKHQIVFVNEGQLQSVLIDKRLVNRILTDLLSNAIKYSPEGSVIRLHISVEEDAIVIQVSDQGIGISAEDQKWLFEPFFRASNVGMARGIGLGLTVVRDCVALHQGTIVVESELQKGTTFTVRLPKQPKHPGGN
jgi:PAS domain S-box-containing protein